MADVLSIENLSKTFGSRRVLDDVSLRIAAGEVHGLVGQNGSGKSTLIKILAGIHSPDDGCRVTIGGEAVHLPLPAVELRHRGVGFVHQDLGLFDGTVLENLRVGQYRTGPLWRIDWRSERRRCRRELEQFSIAAQPDTSIAQLSKVDRALLAILRALLMIRATPQPNLLVLDEPTAYLPRDSVDRLVGVIDELKANDVGVLLVSHRIDEVLALCSKITVLRDGVRVAELEAADSDSDGVVEMMLGRTLDEFYPDHAEVSGELLLAAEGVSGGRVEDFSIKLHTGEIVGVTGLAGMGQEKLLYLLFGADGTGAGTLRMAGEEVGLEDLDVRRARKLGMALLPANRVTDSGVQEATLAENLTLATVGRYAPGGRLRHRVERGAVREMIDEFAIRPPVPEMKLRAFSGGNQQKALVAKWISARPKVLLLDEPTQGVDVASKQEIFKHITAAAESGTAVLISSTEYEDLAGVCDRVIVMADGRIIGELRGSQLTEEQLIANCYRTGP
ncbi:MAG TPA: sugar ABC transporter ATP-binding protein [Solirubrobacterales bacterium]|jgi:ribose transport system ATP-binding protein